MTQLAQQQLSTDQGIIKQWLDGCYKDRLRPATGLLDHPFIDPGSAYTDVLWEWDAFYSAVGLSSLATTDPEIGAHVKGCVDNFVANSHADGSIPYAIMALRDQAPDTTQGRAPQSPRNQSKPLLTQFALLASEVFKAANDNWLTTIRPALENYLEHWYDSQMTPWGVLSWRSHRGAGADNHPAYFQRPHNSVADPYLNSMMVRECQAMAYLQEKTGGDPSPWNLRAMDLSVAINDCLWDPIDGTYYCIDVGTGDPGPVRTNRNWVVPLKIRAYNMVMPLWAGIAPQDRAKSVIEKFILDPNNLRSPHGLYSLAKCEPSFQVFADFNPSDWLGPVWVISTYFAFRALLNYGYINEAEQLAADHLHCLAEDFTANGVLHEYYEPDTGVGLTHPGFVNWNTCASLFEHELKTGIDHSHWLR